MTGAPRGAYLGASRWSAWRGDKEGVVSGRREGCGSFGMSEKAERGVLKMLEGADTCS